MPFRSLGMVFLIRTLLPGQALRLPRIHRTEAVLLDER